MKVKSLVAQVSVFVIFSISHLYAMDVQQEIAPARPIVKTTLTRPSIVQEIGFGTGCMLLGAAYGVHGVLQLAKLSTVLSDAESAFNNNPLKHYTSEGGGVQVDVGDLQFMTERQESLEQVISYSHRYLDCTVYTTSVFIFGGGTLFGLGLRRFAKGMRMLMAKTI